ncbi:hypothetical protein BH11BAC2_BH11BAC2_17250 [soil metagenome]
MKKLLTLLLICTTNYLFAQITIDNNDMANPGDTFRVSLAPITTLVDLTLTGPSYLWDFSQLQANSQDVDSFLNVTNTGAIFSLYFINLPFNPNRASIAQNGTDITAIPQVQFTNVNNFFYESTSAYKQVGFGGEINGIQTPIAFTNKDVIYNFPLNFGDQDSSDSDYSLAIPGLGAYAGEQHRVNTVDGWGTLITPYGTFDAVRVVSDLTGKDSLYLDTLGFGFAFDRALTHEYKWLAKNQGIPLLQIKTSEIIPGTELITEIRYRDNLPTPQGVQNLSQAIFSASILQSNGFSFVKINGVKKSKVLLSIFDLSGKLLESSTYQASGINDLIPLDQAHKLSSGNYLIHLHDGDQSVLLKWAKTDY